MPKLKKYTHRWSIPCEKNIIDSKTNNITLVNVLEEMEFVFQKNKLTEKEKNGEVVLPITLDIVSLWDNDIKKKGELDFDISIFSPTNIKLWNHVPEKNQQEEKPRLRTLITLNGIKASWESGQYKIAIGHRENEKEKYKVVAEIPMVIKIKKI